MIKKFKNTWLKDLCGIEVIDITRHLDFDKGNSGCGANCITTNFKE